MSEDFLAREAAVLGSSFSPTHAGGFGGDVDLEHAASAFPELDFENPDAPVPAITSPSSYASAPNGLLDGFGDFEDVGHSVKVTEDDDVGRFQNDFPELETVRTDTYECRLWPLYCVSQEPQLSTPVYQPPFIAQPQSRPSFKPPIVPVEEDEPEVIRCAVLALTSLTSIILMSFRTMQ